MKILSMCIAYLNQFTACPLQPEFGILRDRAGVGRAKQDVNFCVCSHSESPFAQPKWWASSFDKDGKMYNYNMRAEDSWDLLSQTIRFVRNSTDNTCLHTSAIFPSLNGCCATSPVTAVSDTSYLFAASNSIWWMGFSACRIHGVLLLTLGPECLRHHLSATFIGSLSVPDSVRGENAWEQHV